RGDNSSLSNDPFPDKVGRAGQDHRYITSNFRIARELCEYDDWTPEELQVRRQKLVAWGKERWGSGRIRDLVGQTNRKLQKE
ncbi:MAG: HNH endonuclease, partial [Candidatus Brocadiae bacterium]|nr:HNH endonuclease [Candidatus Brocadiia bacterium]